MMQSSGVCCALVCIYIGNKWDDNWWQSWAINSDSASTHHNSLDSKTIGRLYMVRHPFHSWLIQQGLPLWGTKIERKLFFLHGLLV